jgi:hypothetical protein
MRGATPPPTSVPSCRAWEQFFFHLRESPLVRVYSISVETRDFRVRENVSAGLDLLSTFRKNILQEFHEH